MRGPATNGCLGSALLACVVSKYLLSLKKETPGARTIAVETRRLSQDDRKQRIVEAASRALAKRGFRGTRSRDLAREAGVSEGLLFKYFPDKRSLQKAIIEERVRRTGPLLTPEMLGMPPRQALTAVARAVVDRVTQDPDLMRLLFFSALEGEPLARMLFRRRQGSGVDALAKLVRSWIDRQWIDRRLDAKFVAWSFVACVYQLMVARHIFGVRDVADAPGDLAEKAADLFLCGLEPSGNRKRPI